MKSNLKSGYLVKLRSGSVYCVMENVDTIEDKYSFILVDKEWCYLLLKDYDNQLNHVIFSNLDIMKIYKPNDINNMTLFNLDDVKLVWERVELHTGNILEFSSPSWKNRIFYTIHHDYDQDKYYLVQFLPPSLENESMLSNSVDSLEELYENIPDNYELIKKWDNADEFIKEID